MYVASKVAVVCLKIYGHSAWQICIRSQRIRQGGDVMQALNRLSLCVFLTLAAIVNAFAQSSDEEDLALVYGDKSTVSIATGGKQAITKAPSSATVITAEDIKAMGA